MRIDVWSDLVCPWCYIGKRRLERALAEFPDRHRVEAKASPALTYAQGRQVAVSNPTTNGRGRRRTQRREPTEAGSCVGDAAENIGEQGTMGVVDDSATANRAPPEKLPATP